MGSCISVQNKRREPSATQQNSVDTQAHGFQTPLKAKKLVENQTTDDEGHRHKHHHHHHHHMIEEKVDFRKQTDLKTKELEVHTSIYTSPNTKIVDNKSEGPQQPQQQPCITNASFSPNDDEDCDAMNIPCENAAVQPLHFEKRNAVEAQLSMTGDAVDQNVAAIKFDYQIRHNLDLSEGPVAPTNFQNISDI